MFNANKEQIKLAQEVVTEQLSIKHLLKLVQLMSFTA